MSDAATITDSLAGNAGVLTTNRSIHEEIP